MSRLIEIQDLDALPPALKVQSGDVLWFAATGGRAGPSDGKMNESADVVSLLGIYMQCVIGTNGQVLSPLGSPNTVLFLARQSGRARIEVVTGDPWHEPRTISLDVIVE